MVVLESVEVMQRGIAVPGTPRRPVQLRGELGRQRITLRHAQGERAAAHAAVRVARGREEAPLRVRAAGGSSRVGHAPIRAARPLRRNRDGVTAQTGTRGGGGSGGGPWGQDGRTPHKHGRA